MASNKPYEVKPPKRSTGFNLDALGPDVASILTKYSTVQLRNGAQNLLFSRASDANVSGYGAGGTGTATPSAGNVDYSAAPDQPIQINQNGVVRLQGTGEQKSAANAALNLAKKVKALNPGFWAGLSTPVKIAVIAVPAAVVVIGGAALALRH